MFSLRLSIFLAFFFWALGLQAAPAMHNHNHRSLHAGHKHIHQHLRSRSSHGAPHVLFEAAQAPSESARARDTNVPETIRAVVGAKWLTDSGSGRVSGG
ncbi:hypothetical protein CEP52_000251 [Fusarium oligoseptatum]|uniref:Secreted protein n=1 Tax=Fusarium oligoseptatum TaxID=2604345 RepID=A0A428UQN7_9HYPO|nr:hypothetical protein CEP52_000251 [Fusarium oligoseptatum]